MSERSQGNGIDRRSFLKQSGGTLLTLSLVYLAPTVAKRSQAVENGGAALAAGEGGYQSYDEIYREAWT